MAAATILAAFATAATASVSPYPAQAVLEEFVAVCDLASSSEQMSHAANGRGWAVVTPDPASKIARFVELRTTEGTRLVSDRGGEVLAPIVMQRRLATENLVLVLSGARVNGNIAQSCFMLDLDENREFPLEILEKLMNRSPDQAVAEDSAKFWIWKPGFGSGHRSLSILNVPKDSPAADLLRMSGVGLKADLVVKEQ